MVAGAVFASLVPEIDYIKYRHIGLEPQKRRVHVTQRIPAFKLNSDLYLILYLFFSKSMELQPIVPFSRRIFYCIVNFNPLTRPAIIDLYQRDLSSI
jgi:hypothetical protein